jgi:pyruvate kinase
MQPKWACLLDTKGPEIRTAMLKDGKDIMLEQNQDIIIKAVGKDYETYQGYKTAEETKIGLSYDRLCQSVKPGNRYRSNLIRGTLEKGVFPFRSLFAREVKCGAHCS